MKVFEFEKNFTINKDNALLYADKIGKFLKDYLESAGMNGYVLGLSGGLDSAVAAYLCARAGINLYVMLLPCGDSMRKTGSGARANEVITNLGLEGKTVKIDIDPFCMLADGKRDALMSVFPCDDVRTPRNLVLARENRRARQRMIELFDFGQSHRLLVLGTDNLDEHCLGYFTKYGDGASDIEPLQYCLKSEVRILGEALGVPTSILECAPSAELSENQTDEADLGFSYDDFDRFALTGTSGSEDIDGKIKIRYSLSRHKRQFPSAFMA